MRISIAAFALGLTAASRLQWHTGKNNAGNGQYDAPGGHWTEAPMSLEPTNTVTFGKSGKSANIWAGQTSEQVYNTDFGPSYVAPETLGNLSQKVVFYKHPLGELSSNPGGEKLDE